MKASKDAVRNLKVFNNRDNNYNYYCKLNNNICVDDYMVKKDETNKHVSEHTLYNCSGLQSTNPFCTKEYKEASDKLSNNTADVNYTDCEIIQDTDNVKDIKKLYSNLCKKKYGFEYVFDNNIFDTDTIIKCDDKDGRSKVKCKLDFKIRISEIYKIGLDEKNKKSLSIKKSQ